MNKLDIKARARILACLVEGNSIRATVRMTGAAKNTVVKLLADVGAACANFQDITLRKLPCKRLQLDEIWSFVYARKKNLPEELQGNYGFGDVWTWTAIDADTKLVPCWHVGTRDVSAAQAFISDLADRLANRVQLSTDGHKPYLNAVETNFGGEIDYATIVKIYGGKPEGKDGPRYSTDVCTGMRRGTVSGNPDPAHISTSFVERQNLTMRMGMRRFTRLTNAHSKKFENHMHAISLHFMHYNFGRIHSSLRVTPAMAAGVSDHVWTLEEIAALADQKSN